MIRLQNVTRTYGDAGSTVVALAGISLEIPEHQFAAVTGPSGCGKSTLMHLLGGLDTPSSGEIYVQDLPLHNADDQALTAYRRHKLGIVFQFFNLLPTMSVLENAPVGHLLIQFHMGNMPDEYARKSMRLFWTEVAPRLKEATGRMFEERFGRDAAALAAERA